VIFEGECVRFVLESKKLPSQFSSDLNVIPDSCMNHYTLALWSSVKHYFKDHQRKHSDYSDVFATLRRHSESVTTSKQ